MYFQLLEHDGFDGIILALSGGMMRLIATLAILTLTFSAAPVFAADESVATPAANVVWGGGPLTATATSAATSLTASAPTRPALLPVLYASYVALQAYDVYSTRQALGHGGLETNPLMQGVVNNSGAFWAMKAGVTTATILAAERLWKNDKKAAALGVMIASNAVAAIVARRNAGTLRQLR